MISNFNLTNPEHLQVISAMATMSRTREWRIVKEYLEKEQHNLDVACRIAAPYMASRLGASAHTLQLVLDKVTQSVDIVSAKK